jgi:hypothetical protein
MKLRQVLLSMTGLGLVVAVLVSVDERVREQFERLLLGGDGIASWDNRLMDLGGALADAFKYQSLENGTMLVFAAVGALLFAFMVRA